VGSTQLLIWPAGIFRRGSGRNVRLTTRLNLVSELGMSGGIFLLPLHAFTTWTGTNLSFFNTSIYVWIMTAGNKKIYQILG
jgi:hypothetical protein